MEIVIKIPKELYEDIKKHGLCGYSSDREIVSEAISKGTSLSKIIDSLKELSKDHRHNFVGNSCEERAWRLGIEDSIDLILAESEDKE